MSNDNLSSEETASQAFESGNVEKLGANLFEGMFGESLDANASDEIPEDIEVNDQVEEVTDENEAPVDDASDDESNVEVEETVQDDEDDQEVETDIDTMSITELAEQVGKIEINGKEYTPAQLKSELGQVESAGTKVREASAKLKEAEDMFSKAKEELDYIESRKAVTAKSDQLAQIASEHNRLSQQLQEARNAGNATQITLIRDSMDQLETLHKNTQEQVARVDVQTKHRKAEEQRAILKDRGFDNVINEAYADYVNSELSPSAIEVLNYDASLAIALEKARRYDEGLSKVSKAKKLKSSTKTLKAGTGNKPGSKSTKAKVASKQRLKQGVGTQQDVDTAALSLANHFLS